MNIGIIVYSHTGNTYSVAQKLNETLDGEKYSATLEQVTINSEAKPGESNFQFTNTPAVDHYDAIIFGAPVHAFSLATVMKSYLEQLPSLSGKNVACFVTKQLPLKWTGGNRAVNQMKDICISKGANVLGTEVVIWSKSSREQSINNCIENLSKLNF